MLENCLPHGPVENLWEDEAHIPQALNTSSKKARIAEKMHFGVYLVPDCADQYGFCLHT